MKKKTIVIGITGGIAAYKAAEITSRLVKAGYDVHVFLTNAALDFVTPLTFQTLSKNPVWMDELHLNKSRWVPHIDFATKADLFVIVPASGNTIAKIANGIADNLLTTTVLATKAPILIAGAMNENMYENPITQENINKLSQLGYHFVEPDTGLLACGVTGKGRLAKIERIMESINKLLFPKNDYKDKTVLITAGGTREPIDPVRYIGNRSSGKMGFAIAEAAVQRGAKVILIAANTSLPIPSNIIFEKVETSAEMRKSVLDYFDKADIVFKAAAVADYKPLNFEKQKIKKAQNELLLKLEKNPDILMEIGMLKKNNQIIVGFAAETQDLIKNAQNKIKKKNLDLIVANDITKQGAGFGTETNVVTLLYPNGRITPLELLSKRVLADRILEEVFQIHRYE